MPTLTLPRPLRALTHRLHPTPTPPATRHDPRPALPTRIPAPRRPHPTETTEPAVGTVAVPHPALIEPVASCWPQAQGDVIVLPWLDFMSPHIRYLHTAASAPVTGRGVVVHPSHVLLPEVAPVFWSWWPDPASPTLGTLVVPDCSVARLAHGEHADLRIGPGVYAVRRQRRAELHTTALVED
jgi:hypothetical protein